MLKLEKIRKKIFILPNVLRFGLVNFCNLECPFCHLQNVKENKNKAFMEDEIFYKGIEGSKSFVNKIQFTHFGDALMHSKFFNYVSFAKNKGFLVETTTNGVLLGRYVDEIIDSKIDTVKISVDTLNEEKFAKSRVGTNLEKILLNINSLYEKKKEKKSQLNIIIQYIIPCKEYDNGMDFINTESQFKEKFEYISDGIQGTPLLSYSNKPESIPRIKNCNMVGGNIATIMHDGSVTPCCVDVSGNMSIGNIKNNTLKEIWLSPKAQLQKMQFFIGKKYKNFQPKLCGKCFLHPPFKKKSLNWKQKEILK